MPLSITSPDFKHNDGIPSEYTCEGSDLSPQLAWSGLPEGTRSLALIVDDPDAPDPKAPKRTWVHWVLYNIPVATSGLPKGVQPSHLPDGTLEGMNDSKRTGYGSPCPPIGRHRYFFKLYALDTKLADLGTPTRDALLKEMEGHVLESGELVGTYQKHR
ncbi:MAG TPA: YbhB/YbcL family Raf kinase inhibitor-like protein [Gammaproteobacteria bacterium]|jgi:hypothetical protein